MVEFQHISKTYRVAKRQAGFGNAVRALFSREYEIVHALQDVSFSIGDGWLYWPQRGRKKHNDQNYVRRPYAGQRPMRHRRPHPLEEQKGACEGDRRGIWPEEPALVGCSRYRQF